MKETIGEIVMNFMVECPHCKSVMYNPYDCEWFKETMGVPFPNNGVNSDYEAVCPKCEQEFLIKGFEQ
jgi:hypothetical protein